LTELRKKHDFLVEYAGELIDANEGYSREEMQDDDSVFRYYLRHRGKNWW